MLSEVIVALIVPTVAWLFAATLLALGHYRSNRSATMMGWAYVTLGAGMLLMYLTPFGFAPTRLLANGLVLVAGAFICEAMLLRRGRRMPRAATAALILATLAALAAMLLLGWGLAARIVAASIGIGGLALFLVQGYWRAENRRGADNAILALAVLVALVSFARAAAYSPLGGVDTGGEESLFQSVYWVSVVFSALMIITALALAMIAAIGLETFEALRIESGTDPLTGIHNRRGFEHGAERLIRQAARNGLPVCLILCDLDHFKAVNDRHGHACGDQVIATFARCLTAAAPAPHLVGRLGGEEFTLLLYGVTAPTARLLAEGLRIDFAGKRLESLPSQSFTASFGVAEMTGRCGIDILLARADAALYEAKASGRNRVRIAPARAVPLAAAGG